MGSGLTKKNKIIIDTSDNENIANVTIQGCFYHHPVELVIKKSDIQSAKKAKKIIVPVGHTRLQTEYPLH